MPGSFAGRRSRLSLAIRAVTASLLAGAVLASPALADQVTIQGPDHSHLRWISKTWNPISQTFTDAGWSDVAVVGLVGSDGSEGRGVLRFELAGNIPVGAEITSAELRLQGGDPYDVAEDVSLHKAPQAWSPGYATWNYSDGVSNNWNGGVDGTPDTLFGTSLTDYASYDVTEWAQDWHASAYFNYGVVLMKDGPFNLVNGPYSEDKPQLIVNYETD